MLTISKQQLYRRYDSMTQELKEFLFSEVNSDLLWAIGEAHHLSDDKKFDLLKIVGDVILGFIHPNDLAKNIASDLGIDIRLAQTIDDEVERKIFYSIKSELVKNYQPLAAMGPALVSDIVKSNISDIAGPELEPALILQDTPKAEGELGDFFAGLNGKIDQQNKKDLNENFGEKDQTSNNAPKIIQKEFGLKSAAKTKSSFGGLMGIFGGGEKKKPEAVTAEVQFGTSAEQKINQQPTTDNPQQEKGVEQIANRELQIAGENLSNIKGQMSNVSDKSRSESAADLLKDKGQLISPDSFRAIKVSEANGINIPEGDTKSPKIYKSSLKGTIAQSSSAELAVNQENIKEEIVKNKENELNVNQTEKPKIEILPRVVHYSDLRTPLADLQLTTNNLQQNNEIIAKETKPLNELRVFNLKDKEEINKSISEKLNEINLSQFGGEKVKSVEAEIKPTEIKADNSNVSKGVKSTSGGFFGFLRKKKNTINNEAELKKEAIIPVKLAEIKKEDEQNIQNKSITDFTKPENSKDLLQNISKIEDNQNIIGVKIEKENLILPEKNIDLALPNAQQNISAVNSELGPKMMHHFSEINPNNTNISVEVKEKEPINYNENKEEKKKSSFNFFGIFGNKKKKVIEIPLHDLRLTTDNQQQKNEEEGKEKTGDIGQSAIRESQSVGVNTVGIQSLDNQMSNIAKGIDNIKSNNIVLKTEKEALEVEKPQYRSADHVELKDIPVKEEDTIDLRSL